MILRSLAMAFGVMVLGVGCKSSNRDLLDEADVKALSGKPEIARTLYLRVLRDHSRKDDIRFRAYKGLIDVLRLSFHRYAESAEAMERIIQEFQQESLFRSELDQWRVELAHLYITSLERRGRARELLREASPRLSDDIETQSRLADLFVKVEDWEMAEKSLMVAWEKALKEGACPTLKSLQILAVHLFQSMKRCDRSLEWTAVILPPPCVSDTYSIVIEKAHCYEMMNEPQRAIEILSEFIQKNPASTRVAALISELRERERRREQR